jgi:hypothetical protein
VLSQSNSLTQNLSYDVSEHDLELTSGLVGCIARYSLINSSTVFILFMGFNSGGGGASRGTYELNGRI